MPARRSRTRLMTICGSNGFTSTPSHPTARARDFVDRLEGASQQQHRNVRELRIAFDERRDFVAVALGHPDVRQHDVGPLGLHALDRLPAVADRQHLNVFVRERQLDHPLNGDAVVGEQQFGRHYSLLHAIANVAC